MTAIVLAGGRSSRMGSPKALLPFAGEPLILHIVRRLQPVFSEIVVVAAPDQQLPPMPVTIVHDEVAYQGPVGGIYYGLRAAAGEAAFVTSCDSAFASIPLISYLVAQRTGYDIVVPRWEGRFQPMLAVYARTILPLLEKQLAAGDLRPVNLFDKVRTRIVNDDEIRYFDPEGSSFFNMNTPGDYEEALKLWPRRSLGEGGPVTCTVELFGVARLLAHTRELRLTLPPDATFAHVFAALAEKLPELAGRVISTNKGGLVDGYTCNVNGLEFVRSASVKVKPGDNIAILSADAGG
jgi:molybdopterin-guanine dinucleotide biosynthesis protein A